YTCNRGANQDWYQWSRSGDPYYLTYQRYVNGATGECIEVGPDGMLRQNTCADLLSGSRLTPNDIGGSFRPASQQQFTFLYVSGEAYHIHPLSAVGSCIDIPWSSSDDGVQLQQYPCHATTHTISNQSWWWGF